ncbi:MAG: replication protein, partial [Saprospiraceae bacterium]|nr:replication protein [Saprospiraceae bacterium]
MLGYKQTTHVPNEVFDKWLAILTESEIKILLVIIRQTYGWIDRYTGRRKLRDRITRTQFMMKAGLSARIVSKTLNSLLKR